MDKKASLPQSPSEFGESATYVLPNGLAIHHLNPHETDFLYREIFVERAYLKHGITLHDGDCVFDVGANIGLFALFALQRCQGVTLYAFEPAPQLCAILRQNLAPYAAQVTVRQCGLSDRNGEAVFKFYPHYSILSGFYATDAQDNETLKAGIQAIRTTSDSLENPYLDELVHEKLAHGEEYICQLKTLSAIFQDTQVQRVDLLKIDIEKSEWPVLCGIADNDWPKIRQLVMEVHDSAEQALVHDITALLERHGFVVTATLETALEQTRIFNLYAINTTACEQPATAQRQETASGSPHGTLAEFLAGLRNLRVTLWVEGEQIRVKAAAGVLTPELRAELRDRKAEILAFFRESQQAAHAAPAPLPLAPRDRPLRPSLIQQQLWFSDQLHGPSGAHNLSFGLRLTGRLDFAALEKSLQAIVQRHDILRTTFAEHDHELAQIVHQHLVVPVNHADLRQIPAPEKSAEFQRRAAQEAQKPLDLIKGPLLRVLLFTLGDQEHTLAIIAHHSIFDFLSAPIFMSEFGRLYSAFCENRAPALPELPLQYADFAFWQQQQSDQGRFDATLAYWQNQLAGAPPLLDLPTDAPRPPERSLSGDTRFFDLSPTLAYALQRFAAHEGVSLFSVCLAAFITLLHRYAQQRDILVGVPVSGRIRPEFDHLIGCFASQIVLRTTLADTLTFRELIRQVRDAALAAHAHQDVPFSKIVEVARPARSPQYHPLIQVMFNFLEQPDLQLSDLTLRPLAVANTLTEFDLFLTIIRSPGHMQGVLVYNTAIFQADTIAQISAAYIGLLEQGLQTPESALADLELPQTLSAQAELARARQQQDTIAVAATFTVEPVREALAFWAEKLQTPARIEFAPYNQVFQQLLDPASLLAKNQRGLNIIVIRFEDWQSTGSPDELERAIDELCAAFTAATAHAAIPHILSVCPPSPGIDALRRHLFERMEARLRDELRHNRNTAVITTRDLERLYPVEHYSDEHSERLGHIPYTPEFFAALGTMLARTAAAIKRAPYKVIVLDCDGTLWHGVCGEDGPLGITLDAPYMALQKLMAAQHDAGMLLCLASKNNEADVLDVFAQRAEMPLNRDHFVALRVNWRPKSDNIRDLAEELQLGLDSFIFVDDNPVECAEVAANCPEVLTIQLPRNAEDIPQFLNHVWAFDHVTVTAEDARRTDLYRQNAQREQLRKTSLSFEDFLTNLDVRITIAPMTPAQLPRVSQLTQRTNQFNLTTIRRSESEIQALCDTEGYTCFVADVRDRFGDYGLVGVMIVQNLADRLRVDTLLLSCRALGRGVEHRMLAYLGQICRERGLRTLDVAYTPTAKNAPALDFLKSAGAASETKDREGAIFCFSAEHAANLVYRPQSISAPPSPQASSGDGVFAAEPSKSPPGWGDAADVRKNSPPNPLSCEERGCKKTDGNADGSPSLRKRGGGGVSLPTEASRSPEQRQYARLVAEIAATLARPADILQAMHARNMRSRPDLAENFTPPRNATEETLAAIWSEILELDQVGVHDNFFRLGGHSLLATQALSRIVPRFRLSLPLQTLFDYPTIAELAELITARTREHANADANIPPILPISRAQPLPLSFAQQRLWFLAQLVPDDPSYNIVAAVRISGALDRHMLQQSLNELVTRHEILRTCFPTSDGHPIQQIAPALQIALPLTDMRHVPEDARLAGVERLASEEFQQPFDLARLPLWRVRVLQMRTDEYVVLFTMHHIISDGWSMGIFVREMLTVLTAFAQNQPSPLPELPIQYADFASWQRQWLRGAVLERQLHYWQQRLAGAPPRLELPTDRPRPPIQSYHGDTEIFTLDAELTERLQTLSQAAGATMFMTLLAAFAVLLSRYSRQTDLVIGSPIANRNHPDIEPLIGFFVNTLAFRIDLSGSPTFTELLGRVRQDAFEAYAHQDIPFEQLVEELHPERSLSHAPIVQVMFAFQNTPIPKLEFPGLTLTPLDIPARIAQFDLTVSLQAAEAGLRGELEYNTDLFERATMLRMIAHFQTLLHGIAANPDRPVAALPLITSAERQQLVEEWNRTDAEYPRNVCLHELFEQQAERAPEATAVIDGDRRMTYRELNVRANQLARRLQDCGVGPDVLVGLCVERSCEMIIGMLGILKAGGAYVPLDHTYPQERLTFLLADSGVPVIVTQHALIDRLPEHQAQVIGLDMVGEAPSSETPSQEQAHHPHQTATAAHLAYVIYTSGSTGEPKGVLISHRAVVNRVTSASKNYRLASSDRVLQFASMSFDVSVEEIFATLLAGATIVLRPDVHMLGLDDFMTFLEEQRISLINIPTSYWHAWVAELSRSKRRVPESLRLVVVGTEQASGEHLATWRRIVPERVRWINAYGPTEATITTTIYAPDAQAIAPTAAVPIGRPIENTRIYLLDDLLQPVPVGVPGELHIGGESLARGYLKRPHLTAEKFSADPFGGVPGARLYKTGDLARYLPDGQIEFLGRVDDQIKIRGFRIESGEIEAILTQHPAVREAVVMAREDTPGDPRLVAYVVVETNADGPKAMGSLLREYLKTKLPDYMLPAAFVLLEALPHTPHGKIDRRALPTVESSGLEHDYAAPRTPLEVALAEIWAEVLGLQHVGIRDNFFEIGGYSMLAFRLVTTIQQQLGVKLPLAHLFQSPTIAALATLLHQNPDAPSWSPLVALQPQGSRPPLFCVHPGGGYVFCYLDLARRLGTDQPFYGLQAQGLEDGQEPLDRIEDMAAQYIDALKTVQPRGPYALAGWSFGGFVAFEMAQQLCAQGQRVSLLALLDTFSPAAYRAIPQKLPENDTEHLITILGLDCIPEFDLPGLREQLRHIEPERQLLHVLHAAQPFYPTPADIGVGETRRFLNVDRSQARSLDRYVFRPYPGAMTLFQASERERDQGWEAFAANSVETFIIPGNHYTIMFEPGISILVERLHACLEHARADYEAI